MTRANDFPQSVKDAAVRRDHNRCTAVDCGQTPAWREFLGLCAQAGVPVRLFAEGTTASRHWLDALGVRIRAVAVTSPRRCRVLLERYQFGDAGKNTLEFDHVVEASAGGAATLENCRTLCRICHLDKSWTRNRLRAKAPKVKRYESHGRYADPNVGGVVMLPPFLRNGQAVEISALLAEPNL